MVDINIYIFIYIFKQIALTMEGYHNDNGDYHIDVLRVFLHNNGRPLIN
jgi:hypothetical protein